MSTLRQLIYQVRNVANGGMRNRSVEMGDRNIAAIIDRYRNFLIAQDFKRNGELDSSLEQDLGCLTLTRADASMCSQYCWNENVYWVDLPTPLELPNNAGLTYFGLVNKQARIPISEYSYGNYSNYNRFAPKRIYGEMIGSRVFLHNVDDFYPLEGVNARGVWSSPSNLVTQGSPTVPLTCFDWDTSEYPMLASYESVMMDMIFSKELGIVMQSVTDKKADDTTTEKI